jgi:hypothetical protein
MGKEYGKNGRVLFYFQNLPHVKVVLASRVFKGIFREPVTLRPRVNKNYDSEKIGMGGKFSFEYD